MGYGEIAAIVVSTAVSAAAAAQSASYQAQVAENNQNIAHQNAALSIQEGTQKEAASSQLTAQREAKIAAEVGASGMDNSFGSAVRLEADTASLGETDALTIRNNALNQAIGYQNQGSAFGAQANQDQTAGWLNSFSSLASGTAKTAQAYNDNI